MRWRSVLFTPGDRPDRIEKAWTTGAADVVVADLEDAVAPAGKEAALDAVCDVLERTERDACMRAIRINPYPGRYADAEIRRLADLRPDLVVVPKAHDPEQLERLAAKLPGVGLLAIIETAAGVMAAHDVAGVAGVEALAFGAEDLAADAGMRRSADNVEVAVPRSLVALAAAAHGKVAIDMITADFKDDARFKREAGEALGLGYAGKMCLHPRQVALAHAAWAPTNAEVAWAKQVLDAVAESQSADGGVVVVDGKMVDVPLIRQAEAIIARQG